MSRIIFLTPPAYGHVNPTLPVAQELVRRGHEVSYYNTGEFRPVVEQAGATFHTYPESPLTSSAISAALRDGNLANATALLLRATETLAPFLLEELPRQSPDLVVFDSTAIWGKIVATQLNLRAAASITHFISDLQMMKLSPRQLFKMLWQTLQPVPSILGTRARLSRQYGKAFPPGSPLFPMRDRLNLVFTARELQPDTAILDETFRFVGPSINVQTRGDSFTFDRLGEGPLVYISLGTVHHGDAKFYRQCFATFGEYPARFILSAGRHTAIESLGSIPANFMVRPSVPQLEVLQQADAFITHGGINSMHEALYYGVPLIMLPHQFEQLLNARCAAAHHAAIVLEDRLMRGRIYLANVRHALDALLTDPRYREGANAVKTVLRATGGYQQAAEELEAYLSTD